MMMTSKNDSMGNMCMCSFLKHYRPSETDLFSVRASDYSTGESSFSELNAGNGIPCVGGKVTLSDGITSFPCDNINLLSFVDLAELSAVYGDADDQLSELYGWSDSSGNEIAMVGTFSGVSFVDVTDPFNPKYLGKVTPPSNGGNTFWHDVRTYKDHAYMISENGTMQYMNMTKLMQDKNTIPASGIILNSYAKEYSTTLESTHNLFINEDTGFAYLVGSNQCNQGLYIVDVSKPSNPIYAGCFGDDGYTHDVQCKCLAC